MAAASPSAPTEAPSRSGRPRTVGSRDSTRCRRPTTSTTAASGRLRRNTHRHEAASTSQPPRKGPMAVVMPARPDQAPMARARSSGWKLAWIRARLPGDEEGTGGALEQAGRHQRRDGRGEAAEQRRHREADGAGQVGALAPHPVPHRAADQDERGQGEQVPVGDPGQPGERGVEVLAQAREGHVDHGAVEERHPRAQDGDEQHPPSRGRVEAETSATVDRIDGIGHGETLPTASGSDAPGRQASVPPPPPEMARSSASDWRLGRMLPPSTTMVWPVM